MAEDKDICGAQGPTGGGEPCVRERGHPDTEPHRDASGLGWFASPPASDAWAQGTSMQLRERGSDVPRIQWPSTVRVPQSLGAALAVLLDKSNALALAKDEWAMSEKERPLRKDAAIGRLMQQPNPRATPTKAQAEQGITPMHSASSAEAIVESDAEYSEYLDNHRKMAAAIVRADADYQAALLVAEAQVRQPQWGAAERAQAEITRSQLNSLWLFVNTEHSKIFADNGAVIGTWEDVARVLREIHDALQAIRPA